MGVLGLHINSTDSLGQNLHHNRDLADANCCSDIQTLVAPSEPQELVIAGAPGHKSQLLAGIAGSNGVPLPQLNQQ